MWFFLLTNVFPAFLDPLEMTMGNFVIVHADSMHLPLSQNTFFWKANHPHFLTQTPFFCPWPLPSAQVKAGWVGGGWCHTDGGGGLIMNLL